MLKSIISPFFLLHSPSSYGRGGEAKTSVVSSPDNSLNLNELFELLYVGVSIPFHGYFRQLFHEEVNLLDVSQEREMILKFFI